MEDGLWRRGLRIKFTFKIRDEYITLSKPYNLHMLILLLILLRFNIPRALIAQ